MFSLAPHDVPATRASTDAVLDLISVLANPDATKQALASIKSMLNDMDVRQAALIEQGNKVATEISNSRAEFDAREVALAEREKKIADLQALSDQVDAKQAALATATATLDRAQLQATQRLADADKREAATASREDAVASREAEVVKREAALKAAEANYQQRLATLKALAG